MRIFEGIYFQLSEKNYKIGDEIMTINKKNGCVN